MGWLSAIGSMFSWLGGEGIGSSLARIAIGLGISKLLNKNNESGAGSNSASTPQGTRQQIAAATDNKIPVAYGDSYFSGTVVDQRTINDNKETVVVLDLCEVTGDIFSTNPTTPSSRTASDIVIDAVYLNNQIVTFKADGTTIDYTTDDTGVRDDNASGLCGIYLYKGSSNQPMLPCALGTRTPISGTVPPVAYEIMPGWDTSYTNQNKIFALVKMNYDPSKGLHSLPTFKFHVKNTMNKAGDCLHDYMTNVMYGAGLPEALVDNQSIIDLNAYGDEDVTLGTYPAQPRYRINGLARTTETVMSNMEKIAAAGGSVISYDIGTGKFAAVVNKLVAKTLDFDDSNILGQIAVYGTDLTAMYNKVEVQFPYKVLKDQYNYVRFDLPEIYRNSNEPDNTMQITHEFVNDPVQATILANLDLRQSREDLSITFKTDYSKYNVAIGTIIGVTNSVYGWTSKLFKVIRIRKNESDSGQLTIEITAQAYNADVFTVEDISDFVPLIGVGHSLPSLTPIQQPLAPTLTSSTVSSQPSVTITGIVPTGVVTEMEFWYTSSTLTDDNARPYTQLGTMRAENGGPFTIGDVVSFKTVLLASGTYYCKVRANNNGSSTSKFSPPSLPLAYVYVQAPDVLKYNTPSVDDSGEEDADSMNYGMMAAYLGYKLFEKPITDYLKEKFGITDEQAEKANAAVVKDNASSTNSTAAVNTANSANTTAQSAAATAASAEAKANAALAAVGNPPVVMKTSTLKGHVFPCAFGSGPEHGKIDSRAGIFTHDHLVFGGGAASLELLPTNIVAGAITLSANVSGQMQNFYNIPTLSSGMWSQKPNYNEALTDKYATDTQVSLYYSEATYTSGNLDQQSWSAWKKIGSDNGVSGSDAHVDPIQVWTNPPPVKPAFSEYIVEEIKQTDGVGNVALAALETTEYDPFKPNVLKTIGSTSVPSTKAKSLTVTVPGWKAYDGTKLVIFGTSVYNLPDNTPFNNNTVFGHQSEEYLLTYPESKSFRMLANNGTVFVGIESGTNSVYYSFDGIDWKPIYYENEVTNRNPSWLDLSNVSSPDNQKMPNFNFVVYDGSKFIAYSTGIRIATSVDGMSWTEPASTNGLDSRVSHVIANDGHYLAISDHGVQTSADGITWSAMSLPASLGVLGPRCGTWDGSKFIVGKRRIKGVGSSILSSTDGATWTSVGVDSVNHDSRIAANETDELDRKLALQNNVTQSALP